MARLHPLKNNKQKKHPLINYWCSRTYFRFRGEKKGKQRGSPNCAFISAEHFWFCSSSRIISTNHVWRNSMQYCEIIIMANMERQWGTFQSFFILSLTKSVHLQKMIKLNPEHINPNQINAPISQFPTPS